MRFIKEIMRMALARLLAGFMEKALLYLLSLLGIMFSLSLLLRFIPPGFDNTSSPFVVVVLEGSEPLPKSIREDVLSSFVALEEKKYDKAITSLSRVINREPKTEVAYRLHGFAYQLRSLAYEKKGKNHEAVKDSTKRIKLIQEMKQKQKEYTIGKEDTIGDEIDAYYARSHIYLKLGKKEKAAEDWKKISVLQASSKEKYGEYYQQ